MNSVAQADRIAEIWAINPLFVAMGGMVAERQLAGDFEGAATLAQAHRDNYEAKWIAMIEEVTASHLAAARARLDTAEASDAA